MAIKLACSGCGRELKANEKQAGKRVRCPRCNQIQEVPLIDACHQPSVVCSHNKELPLGTVHRQDSEPSLENGRIRWGWPVLGVVITLSIFAIVFIVVRQRNTWPTDSAQLTATLQENEAIVSRPTGPPKVQQTHRREPILKLDNNLRLSGTLLAAEREDIVGIREVPTPQFDFSLIPKFSGSSSANLSEPSGLNQFLELQREIDAFQHQERLRQSLRRFETEKRKSHLWQIKLGLVTEFDQRIAMGSDMLLFEINGDTESYHGYCLFGRSNAKITSPETYGLPCSPKHLIPEVHLAGSNPDAIETELWQGMAMGQTSAGKPWTLTCELPRNGSLEFVPLDGIPIPPASVWIVLPELSIEASQVEDRYRAIAVFSQQPGAAWAAPWAISDQRLIAIDSDELRELLNDPSSNLVLKTLAANWLAEYFPREAAHELAAVVNEVREGELLKCCLTLLTNLKVSAVEPHAYSLLEDAGVSDDVRGKAAEYLGSVRYPPAFEPLLRSVSSPNDDSWNTSAIKALGLYGGEVALQKLAEILNDKEEGYFRRSTAADGIVTMKSAAAFAQLKDAITNGNDFAFEAVIRAGPPEMFDYFVELAAQANTPGQRFLIARALKSTGGPKALDSLIQLLKQNSQPGAEGVASFFNPVERTIVELNMPEATPILADMAQSGDLNATYILAESTNESVFDSLKNLLSVSNAGVRKIALNGLKKNWRGRCEDLLLGSLSDTDIGVVDIAVEGLQQSKSPLVLEKLMPLLEHSEQRIRSTTAHSIENLPLGDNGNKIANILMRSNDPVVIAACAKSLLKANWQNAKAVQLLSRKLPSVEGFKYDFIALLRNVSGNPMGPANQQEFTNDPDGWVKKWMDWAHLQTALPEKSIDPPPLPPLQLSGDWFLTGSHSASLGIESDEVENFHDIVFSFKATSGEAQGSFECKARGPMTKVRKELGLIGRGSYSIDANKSPYQFEFKFGKRKIVGTLQILNQEMIELHFSPMNRPAEFEASNVGDRPDLFPGRWDTVKLHRGLSSSPWSPQNVAPNSLVDQGSALKPIDRDRLKKLLQVDWRHMGNLDKSFQLLDLEKNQTSVDGLPIFRDTKFLPDGALIDRSHGGMGAVAFRILSADTIEYQSHLGSICKIKYRLNGGYLTIDDPLGGMLYLVALSEIKPDLPGWPKLVSTIEGSLNSKNSNTIEVSNGFEFPVIVGIRTSSGSGIDFWVEKSSREMVHVPNGRFEMYFQFVNGDREIYQGDSIMLKRSKEVSSYQAMVRLNDTAGSYELKKIR